jgi:signal transduction histidine kinase
MMLPFAGQSAPPPEQSLSCGREERVCVLLVLFASLLGLWWTSHHNYLLFHSLVEMYNVVVLWGVFFVTWSARRLLRSSCLLMLGVSSLFVGFLYLLHMLAYKGMGVFSQADANLPTQLWIAARLLQGLSFAAAAASLFRPKLDISAPPLAAFWGLLTLLSTWLVFTGRFPVCFVEGSGLTLFKQAGEWLAIVLLLTAGLLIWLHREQVNVKILRLLLAALLLTAAAGFMFTRYASVYGPANMLGHFFNLGSSYCLFRAFIRTGITAPQALLFHELNRRQEELEQSKDNLEQQVRQRTANLHQKNKELEESNQRLNDFAYSISHDLREPLRGMYNFAHFLAEDYRDSIDQDGREMLDTIMRLAKRLDAQVLAVLKYSRIGRLDLDLHPTDLDRLLDEVIDSLQGRIAAAKVRIKRPEPLPHILCHAEYVREAFHNLISNAVIYNDKDIKEIAIGWHPPGFLPAGVPMQERNAPVFYVRDNGIGIPEKHFQKIFGIFRRLHGQDKYGGGTGVGLTIARQVIERHGGLITLKSEPGKGTTFYFTLSSGES